MALTEDVIFQALFLYINIDDDDNLNILEFFGMKTSECPALRFIILNDDMLKFKPASGELTVTDIQQFVDGVLAGTVKVCSLTVSSCNR